jgi:hypothetical protein
VALAAALARGRDKVLDEWAGLQLQALVEAVFAQSVDIRLLMWPVNLVIDKSAPNVER